MRRELFWTAGAALLIGTASCGGSDDDFLISEASGGARDGGAGKSAGGTSGSAPADGSLAEQDGDGSAGETSAEAASGGEGGVATDGSAGADAQTAGSGGAGGGCQQTWCFDGDQDGHGNPANSQTACNSPGAQWTQSCDDCHDGNKLVHPGALSCQTEPYTALDGTTKSFDFDCDGKETECGQPPVPKWTRCEGQGLGCSGSGYQENLNRPAQGRAGQNLYCGSTRWCECAGLSLTQCGCSPTPPSKPAIPCG